jgi:hypothetical protein
MIDCGAEGNFIDKTYTAIMGIKKTALARPIKVRNVDGTFNKAGTITHYVNVTLDIGERKRNERLLVTKLGKQRIILGTPWLKKENPDINWKLGKINWRDEVHPQPSSMKIEEEEDEPTISTVSLIDYDEDTPEDLLLQYIGTDETIEDIYINATLKPSQEFALKYEEQKQITVEERIPKEYHEYLDVFKEEVERFPESRVWDHTIDMKLGFEPKSFKSYNLTPEERKQQELFIKENLKKGYIRPSKSPMASPFFFVSKKDRKLRPTQDYRYLNQWTIKNTYPLPLISEIMDKIKASGAKYFTKFDIRWGFNNIRIKEGDQWKAAFKTNLGLYEPTVMFFGLCNSPATFQAMMNEILKDKINEGWVIVYMDDILIFAKDKNTLERMTKQVLQRL